MFLKMLIMASNKGLRFPENVIEADNMYQILLILLQGALWDMYQVQRPQNYEKILIDENWFYEIALDNLDLHRTRLLRHSLIEEARLVLFIHCQEPPHEHLSSWASCRRFRGLRHLVKPNEVFPLNWASAKKSDLGSRMSDLRCRM